eukprot:TRINITY_DN3256_c0_g2_i1.p1 TRINITY_DN3256_c0_g2~~TRINITY_DN3256_c0_g2_i1.p1  ORF type:complete len:617 (-),score=191.61 TRINITY_DN3256_c0_g2_i1:162-2012(-)
MSVVGIDLGTHSTVVGIVRGGGIDIVVNDVSNRRTPFVCGFGEKQRAIGESGKTQQARNMKHTVSGVKRLLGRKFSDPTLKKELYRYGGCNFVELPDGGIGIEASLRYKKQTFTTQQLTGMFLAHLAKVSEAFTSQKFAHAVISVPGYFTDAQRLAVFDAAKIAGISCLSVINELSALAIAYGFYKTDIEKPLQVMIIDFGATTLSVAIAEFTKEKCEILGTAYDPHLGGYDIDELLADYFAKRFLDKYKLDVKANPRAWQRILDAVEKTKKSLNENESAGISIECILEERDLNDRITKAEYISLLEQSGILSRVVEPLKTVLQATGLEAKNLHAIEWVGSAMRAVPIQDAVVKFIGRPLSATMNVEEAVAKGCALQCAILSPLLKVRDYKLIDIQQYPINLTWKTLNESDDSKTVELFPLKQQYGKSKYITFTRKGAKPFEMTASYANPSGILIPDTGNGNVVHAVISNINKEADKDGNKDAEVRVKVRLAHNGLCSLVSAELVEEKEYTVEVPVEEEKKDEKKDEKKEEKKPEDPATPPPAPAAQPEGEEVKKDGDGDTIMKDAVPEKPKTITQTKVKTVYTNIPMECKYVQLSDADVKKFKELGKSTTVVQQQ